MIKITIAIRIWLTFLFWDIIGTMWNYAEIGDYRIELKRKKVHSYRIYGFYTGRFVQRPSIADILGIL